MIGKRNGLLERHDRELRRGAERTIALRAVAPHTPANPIGADVVAEILSPTDQHRDVEEKIRVYMACGTTVLFLVDTKAQTATSRDAEGSHTFCADAVVEHRSLPGFALPSNTLFELP